MASIVLFCALTIGLLKLFIPCGLVYWAWLRIRKGLQIKRERKKAKNWQAWRSRKAG